MTDLDLVTGKAVYIYVYIHVFMVVHTTPQALRILDFAYLVRENDNNARKPIATIFFFLYRRNLTDMNNN